MRGGRPQGNFDVFTPNMSSYRINNQDDPTLTLTRGETYTFNVIGAGHPLWIVTTPGAGDVSLNEFQQGVANNGASPGIVTFVVPMSAPATLYYQCSFHDPMVGTLNIITAPVAAAVPSIGQATSVALACLLLLVATAILRHRARAAARSHDQ